MTLIDGLLMTYRREVSLPWDPGLAPAQRVWMAVYPPDQERRVRLHLDQFEVITKEAGHPWSQIDITCAFEQWLGDHSYRDAYFESPRLLGPALSEFNDVLAASVREQLQAQADPDGVVGLVGAGSLFGLGDTVKGSALIERINDAIAGRLLVFFPGQHDGNNYRLLDARDGWNYLATAITPQGS